MSQTSSISKPHGKRRPRQPVAFAETEAEVVCEVESCFDYPENIRRALWHSRSEYQFAKLSARVVAKESERYGYSRHLDGVYVSSYEQEVQDSLNMWCLHGNGRRGIERWSNGSHGQIRKEDQYQYFNGVLRAQAEMRLKGQHDEERLREVSHVLSKKARLLAKMLGNADREAAKWEFGMTDCPPSTEFSQLELKPVRRSLNLGLSNGSRPPVATRVSLSPQSTALARRVGSTRTANIRIRTKSGRVPRMA